MEDISNRGTANLIFLDMGQYQPTRLGCSFHVPGSLLPPYSSTTQLFFKRNITLYGEGKGLLDAWEDLQTRTTRDVYFGQIGSILLSDRFARAGIKSLLDFVNRRAEIPHDANVVVTKNDPRQLVDLKLANNFMPGTYIQRYFQSSAKRSLAPTIQLWEINAAFANKTSDIFIPYISPSQKQYRITGLALYSGEHLVGETSKEETIILSMIQGSDYAYLTVPIGKENLVAFFAVRTKTQITPRKLKDGRYLFDIKVKASGLLRETYPDNSPITMGEKRQYDRVTERYIKARMERLLAKLQHLKSDPLGFGRKLRARYPDAWDKMNWHQVYAKAKIIVNVKFNFEDTGSYR